jgi:hypothetical protein
VVLDVGDAVVRDVRFVETAVMRWYREEVVLSRDDDEDALHDKVRARIDEVVDRSGKLLAAVRLTVRGGSKAHAAVVRHPDKIVAQIRADALDRGDVWIEKVRLDTTPQTPIDQLRDAHGLVADLLKYVQRVREDEGDAELLHVARVLDPLRKKLAAELDAAKVDLASPERLRAYLDAAEALLAQRLTERSE